MQLGLEQQMLIWMLKNLKLDKTDSVTFKNVEYTKQMKLITQASIEPNNYNYDYHEKNKSYNGKEKEKNEFFQLQHQVVGIQRVGVRSSFLTG